MTTHEKPRAGATCIAPTGDVPDDSLEGVELCGAPATTTRVVEQAVCPLCDACAAEIDADDAATSRGAN